MSQPSQSHPSPTGIAWRDRISTILMVIASAGAFFAFLAAIASTRDAESDRQIVEMWRMYGFLVFSALFLLLALRPRNYPGVWEVTLFHKGAVAATALVMYTRDVSGAGEIAAIDGGLAIMIAVAYVLSRGYRSWRATTPKTEGHVPDNR